MVRGTENIKDESEYDPNGREIILKVILYHQDLALIWACCNPYLLKTQIRVLGKHISGRRMKTMKNK